jgi:hypothetical protein
MSLNGYKTMEYYGNKNKIKFPDESFLIAGISFYQNNLDNICDTSELYMEEEPTNKFDSTAIKILYINTIIGYVPKNDNTKCICKENIGDKLKIINIKKVPSTNNIGIRVIPEKYYKDEYKHM